MRWKASSGLTLLELLVALSLLAILLVGLLSTTQFGLNVLDRAQRQDDFHTELAMRVRLRGWLERAQPPVANNDYPFVFSGTEQELSFVTLSETPYFPETFALKVIVRAAEEGLVAVLEGLDESGATIHLTERRLNVSGDFIIEYWDMFASEPQWQRTWDDARRIPHMVKIVRLADSTPYWPEFVVAPLLARRPN